MRRKKHNSLADYQVILHNSSVNRAQASCAIASILRCSLIHADEWIQTAQKEGKVVLCNTHQERAEMLIELFENHLLTVTIEKCNTVDNCSGSM
jgi:hypothetical protein